MATGKNIEIKIAATGGDQAAAEIKKVTAASEAAQTTGFGGMLENSPARDEAHEKRLSQIASEADALKALEAEQSDSVAAEIAGMKEKEAAAAEYAEQLKENASNEKAGHDGMISRATEVKAAAGGIAIAAGLAARTLSNIVGKFSEINTADLGGVDAGLAKNIESAKALATALNDPIAALAALVSGGQTLDETFAGMNEQLRLTAQQNADQIDRILQRGVVQVSAIKKLTDELSVANALLAAKDKTAGLKDQEAAAEAIRNGADPNDVAESMAIKERDRERARIGREMDENNAPVPIAFENAKRLRLNLDNLIRETQAKAADLEARIAESEKKDPVSYTSDGQQDGGFETQKLIDQRRPNVALNRQKVQDAQDAAKAAQKEAERVQKEAQDKNRMLAEERDQLGIKTNIAVAEAQANKQEEARKKAASEARGYYKEWEGRESEDKRESRQQDKGNLESAEERLSITASRNQSRIENSGIMAGNRNPQGQRALKDLAKDIGDADTTAEINAVKDAVKAKSGELGAAVVEALTAMVSKQEEQVKAVNAIKDRLRRLEAR